MIKNENRQDSNTEGLNTDPHLVKKALDKAARAAIAHHRSMGRKIPYWENNQVVWRVPKADDIRD